MEGNETLHTSHLQCHIFIPLLVFPLPASASHQQHPSVDKRKDLLPVLHLLISFKRREYTVCSPLSCFRLCSAPSHSSPHFRMSDHMVCSTNQIIRPPPPQPLQKQSAHNNPSNPPYFQSLSCSSEGKCYNPANIMISNPPNIIDDTF